MEESRKDIADVFAGACDGVSPLKTKSSVCHFPVTQNYSGKTDKFLFWLSRTTDKHQ